MPDTDMAEPLTRRRTMMAAAAERASLAPEEPMRAADGTVRDWFRFRTGYQQFMRENEPLFRALAASADDPYELLSGGGLADAAEAAKAVAVAAARRLTGRSDPAAQEIRPFRVAAATVVAATWRAGRLRHLDPGRIGAELAAASTLVDEDLDRSLFASTAISDEASLRMTAMSVSLRLMEPVMTYDFRRDRAELVAAMATAVMETAAEASRDLVPEDARADDRRSLIQTLASCLSAVMAQVYERKARTYVAHVVTIPETDRESFSRRYDPMPEVLRSFRDNAKVYAGSAYAAARAADDAVGGPRWGEATPR